MLLSIEDIVDIALGVLAAAEVWVEPPLPIHDELEIVNSTLQFLIDISEQAAY